MFNVMINCPDGTQVLTARSGAASWEKRRHTLTWCSCATRPEAMVVAIDLLKGARPGTVHVWIDEPARNAA